MEGVWEPHWEGRKEAGECVEDRAEDEGSSSAMASKFPDYFSTSQSWGPGDEESQNIFLV